jgi:hypothetical protein
MLYEGVVKFRAERGLADAIAEAARRDRTKSSEWTRRVLRQAVVEAGVTLPPIETTAEPARSAP